MLPYGSSFSVTTADLFEEVPAAFGVAAASFPWELLTRLQHIFETLDATPGGGPPPGVHVIGDGPMWIDPSANVFPGAALLPPLHIGPRSRVLPGGFVRASWIGADCLVGHAVEIARSVCMDGAAIPHQSIVLDSVIGRGSNIAGGARFANLPLKWVGSRGKGRSILAVDPLSGSSFDTGMEKLGFLCGDGVLTPMTLATNPGTIVGKNCIVMPRNGVVLGGTWLPGTTIRLEEVTAR